MVDFVPVSSKDIEAHLSLFQQTFPASAQFSAAYLNWLYFENPDGMVCGFNAVADETVVATYVCIPVVLSLRGEVTKGLLSLNTATAPSHQGQGLFTKLASMTYELGHQRGYTAVYGVANQNSIGGFSRKLGFQDVAPLDARIGVLDSDALDVGLAENMAEFQRCWSAESLKWRVSNPKAPLGVEHTGRDAKIVGQTQYPIISVQTQMLKASLRANHLRISRLFNLYIGKAPTESIRKGFSIAIPDRLKPSPLRLIYRSLLHPTDRIDPDRVLIRFVDFDAY